MRTTADALRTQFAALAPTRIVLETSTASGWVSRWLEQCGPDVIVAHGVRRTAGSTAAGQARTQACIGHQRTPNTQCVGKTGHRANRRSTGDEVSYEALVQLAQNAEHILFGAHDDKGTVIWSREKKDGLTRSSAG